MSIPIIGDIIDGVAGTAQSYFKGKKEEVEAKSRQRITKVTEEGESTRKAIAAEAGTKRALINKNMRLMRRIVMVVLLLPFFAGALIIAGTYLSAWWSGAEPSPDFTALSLFWTEVVGATPQWWVNAIQGMFAFLWAGGEITNVGAQAGGAVMDHFKRNRDADRKLERERRNREREARGEQPLSDNPDEEEEDDPIVHPGPPRGLP